MIIAIGIKNSAVDAKLQREKTVEKLAYGNEPVELLEVKLVGKSIKLGERLAAADDWLRGLSLALKNRSNKPIVFVEIALDFPETKDSGPKMSYRIRLGQDQLVKSSDRPPLHIAPGEPLQIDVAGEYDKLKTFLEARQHISSINRAAVRISFIEFEDGTAWGAGAMLRPDPDNPKRYIPIRNQ